MMNARDIHVEYTAASMLCLILDLFGDALWHTAKHKMFRRALVS